SMVMPAPPSPPPRRDMPPVSSPRPTPGFLRGVTRPSSRRAERRRRSVMRHGASSTIDAFRMPSRPDAPAASPEREAIAWGPPALLIDGRWCAAGDLGRLQVEDPATGRVVCEVADATVADCERALAAAHTTQPLWAARAPRERARVLRRAADALRDEADRMA